MEPHHRMAKKPLNDYAKLKKIWYDKLEKSGFDDIEDDQERLKSYSSIFVRKDQRMNALDTWQAKAAYYSMAEQFLNDFEFESKFQRIVWEYHANGISIRDISKLLKKARVKRTINRDAIWLIIKELEHEMKVMYKVIYDNE